MHLFMDVHTVSGATAEAVAGAHQKDLLVQPQYGVKHVKYWLDEGTGKIFCLAEAPDKEAAIRVHREAHGLVADEIGPLRAVRAKTPQLPSLPPSQHLRPPAQAQRPVTPDDSRRSTAALRGTWQHLLVGIARLQVGV